MMDAQTLILNKLDSIDKKIDRFNQRITTLETETKTLFDNGQPGRVTKIEDRLTALEEVRWKAAGWVGSALLALEVVGHILWSKITGR